MLKPISFYKSSPTIMKSSRSKRDTSTVVASSAAKKRMVRSNGAILMEKNDAGGNLLSNSWTPRVLITKLRPHGQHVVRTAGTRPDDNVAGCSSVLLTRRTEDHSTIGSASTSKQVNPKSKVKVDREAVHCRLTARVASLRSRVKEEVKEEEEVVVEDEEEAALPSNHDGSDDGSGDENGHISAYEKRRLENIKENANFFASLGILSTKNRLSNKKQRNNQIVRKQTKKEPVQRRPPSLRIRRIDPEGIAVPESPAEPANTDHREAAIKSGPLDMEPTNLAEYSGENLQARLLKLVKEPTSSPKSSAKESDDLGAFATRMQNLSLISDRIAKVTEKRICSLVVHPSRSKVIVCAGDKGGNIGVWDVDSRDGQYQFAVHSGPIYGLKFAPRDTTKLFSSGYDGKVRCGDFVKGVFDEIHSANVDADDVSCSNFDFLSADGDKLIVAHNQRQGYAQVVDTRLRCHTSSCGYHLHNRNVKTIHVHPTDPNYFITASVDNTVALWDIRALKERKLCKSLLSLPHERTVSSAYFSPVTGKKIVTTSLDHALRIFTLEEKGKQFAVQSTTRYRHNNHTGRWLTPFRTVWHPTREDVIMVGCMDQPRRIHLFSDSGNLVHNFYNPELLVSICSINAFHPTRDIVVGCNSSGRVHVFM